MRRRLSNISWFMAVLCENIARRANKEDECTGRFWESRFKCRKCADLSGMLISALYVDLNPINAGEAASLRTALYTSAHQRIQAMTQRGIARNRADGWLGELTFREGTLEDETIAYSSRSGRRASDLASEMAWSTAERTGLFQEFGSGVARRVFAWHPGL